MAFGVFIAADDLTVVSTMLRQMIVDLEIALPADFDDAAWIVNSYLVAYVAVMPFMGKLSDLFGRRKVFVGALALFMLGSIWLPFAPSLPSFIAGRVVTAIGGGAMVPVALAAIGDAFEKEKRPTAFGVLGAVDTIGWVWGPLFGAILVRYLSWKWQFYLNVPLALAGIALAWWALRDYDRPAARGKARIDWAGAGLLALALVAVNIALLGAGDISTAGSIDELNQGETDLSLPLLGLAALAMAAFIFVEQRVSEPLIDIGLFKRRNFTPAVIVNFLVGAVLIIAMVDVPLFVNLVIETNLERAALLSGWVLSTLTATMAIAAYIGGRATERTWYRPVVLGGLGASFVAFLLMGLLWSESTSLLDMAWQLGILGLGFGLVIAPTHSAVVDAAPEEDRGVAAGLVIVARLMGLSVGLSGLTAWGLYRFDTLRTKLVLPPIDDATYADALELATAQTTATAIAETFLFSVALVGLAILVATALRRSATR